MYQITIFGLYSVLLAKEFGSCLVSARNSAVSVFFSLATDTGGGVAFRSVFGPKIEHVHPIHLWVLRFDHGLLNGIASCLPAS